MPTPFIRYTPDIEAADPRFDETLQTVIAKTEQYIAASVTTEGTGRAVRDAHAKGYGLVRAEVDILDRLPALYAQGIYAKPGRHDALIRFSNGSPDAGADARLGGATGLALKMFGIDGPTLLGRRGPLATMKVPASGSHETRRWRKMDSNFRFPVAKAV